MVFVATNTGFRNFYLLKDGLVIGSNYDWSLVPGPEFSMEKVVFSNNYSDFANVPRGKGPSGEPRESVREYVEVSDSNLAKHS